MKIPKLTYARLREVLEYDPATGAWTWLIKRPGPKSKVGAGCINKVHGYHEICIDHILYKAHRLAVLYMTGEWPTDEVDHRNVGFEHRKDNRWENLRDARHGQNQSNSPAYRNSKTGVKGVYWHKYSQRWRAQCQHNGKSKCIGDFKTIEEAKTAYDAYAKLVHGEFARS